MQTNMNVSGLTSKNVCALVVLKKPILIPKSMTYMSEYVHRAKKKFFIRAEHVC